MSCGPGTSIRSRQCNNPAPSAGGKQCTGLPVGNKPCNEGPCPGRNRASPTISLRTVKVL